MRSYGTLKNVDRLHFLSELTREHGIQFQHKTLKDKIVIHDRDNKRELLYSHWICRMPTGVFSCAELWKSEASRQTCFNVHFMKMLWTRKAQRLINSGEIVSVDFWNTLCSRKTSALRIRKNVCGILINQYDLQKNVEVLLEAYSGISAGLRAINSDKGFFAEYDLLQCWFFTGILLNLSSDLAKKFAADAVRLEIDLTYKHSQFPLHVVNFLNRNQNASNLFILSDFEGGRDFLTEIAARNFAKLPSQVWVSSEIKFSKHSGRMFQELKNCQTNSRKISHFGDNKSADVRVPREMGIDAFQVFSKMTFWENVLVRIHNLLKKTSLLFAVKLLPTRATEFEHFLKVLCSIWRRNISRAVQAADEDRARIAYIGSEGAFASNLSIETNARAQSCINFGRKVPLKATLETNPSWTFSRMLLEQWTLDQICSFSFTVSNKELCDELHLALSQLEVEKFFERHRRNINCSSEFLSIMTTFPDKNEPIVVVDIGYKSSFASSLVLLGYMNVYVAQMFSTKISTLIVSTKSEFGFIADTARYRSRIKIDAEFLETVFSWGPRAPKVTDKVLELKVNLFEYFKRRIPHEEDVELENVKNVQIQKILHFPERNFVSEIVLTKWPIDDLSAKDSYFNQLPWSQKRHTRSPIQHFHLLRSYLKNRI